MSDAARDIALEVLRRVSTQAAFASAALRAAFARLPELAERDRGLATELVYGVLRRRLQIDRAIGGLYFEPFDDPARDADVTLANLGRLLSSVAEGLDECECFVEAVARVREAVEHLNGARALLVPAAS